MEKQILVAKEVAELLRVDVQRVYELTRTDQIPGVIKIGKRQYRYSAEKIQKFLRGEETQKLG